MFVCVLVFVIRHANRIFSTQYYVVMCGLSGCTEFFHIISYNGMIFGEKLWNIKVCFDFLYNYVRKIFSSKRNLARYFHKCTYVFM